MLLIKLDAIDSTNDFLKDLAASQPIENFTVVTAEAQLKGKGQMGSRWLTEPGKNLVMSVFVRDPGCEPSEMFVLNAAVAIAVAEALSTTADIAIKWPNDIMADGRKLGGILIENSFTGSTIRSIIGIGLNVNQTDFTDLPYATSLQKVTGHFFEIDVLLELIVEKLKTGLTNLKGNASKILERYNEMLYRRGRNTDFCADQDTFTAEIIGVGADGLLQLQHTAGAIIKYDLKQIRMIYEPGNSR